MSRSHVSGIPLPGARAVHLAGGEGTRLSERESLIDLDRVAFETGLREGTVDGWLPNHEVRGLRCDRTLLGRRPVTDA